MSTKIYTKTGDSGETSLVGGYRVSKTCARVDAYGTIDETNTFVGVAFAQADNAELRTVLEFVMHKLFNCSSALAHPADIPPKIKITTTDIKRLEDSIDHMEATVSPSPGFVLPTGCPLSAQLHMARTVCRRAERRLFLLHQSDPIDENILRFINRLSDLLFASAQYANYIASHSEILWDSSQ